MKCLKISLIRLTHMPSTIGLTMDNISIVLITQIRSIIMINPN